MATPSDGTFGSFIKSRNGIAVIIVIGLPILLSMLAAVLIPIIVAVTAEKTSDGGIKASSFLKSELDDGWIRYEYKESPRFAIELPEGWEVTGFSAEELAEIYDTGIKSNQELNDLLSDPDSREIIECCMKMIAYDRTKQTNSEFSTNINIIADQISSQTDFDSYVDDQLSFVDTPGLQLKTLRPAQGQGSMANFEQDITTPAGRSLTLALTQFYFLKGSDVLIVTATTPESDAAHYDDIFQRIGASVTWL